MVALGVSVVRGPFSWLNQACWAGFVASVALTVLLVEWEVVVWPVHDLRAVDKVSCRRDGICCAAWLARSASASQPASQQGGAVLLFRAADTARSLARCFPCILPACLQRLAMWADATTAAAFAAAADDTPETHSSTGGGGSGSGGFIKAHNRSAEAEAYEAAAATARTLSMGQPQPRLPPPQPQPQLFSLPLAKQ